MDGINILDVPVVCLFGESRGAPNFPEGCGSLGRLQRHVARGDAGGLLVINNLVIRPAHRLRWLPLGRQRPSRQKNRKGGEEAGERAMRT